MDAALLSRLYGMTARATRVNVRDVTPAESLVRPPAGGNSMNWLLGHIVNARNEILALLGEEPVLDEEQTRPYRRSTDPMRLEGGELPWEVLLDAYEQSQARIEACLARATHEALAEQLGDGNTRGTMLALLHFHETYHAGQIGLMRRVLGKPGMIK